jgi:transposase InsO family protein
VKYAWIQAHQEAFGVRQMCGLLDVSRSQYYEWRTGLQSPRSLQNERLTAEITLLVVESRYRYGTRRVQRGLAQKGLMVSRRRIGRIMKEQHLTCKTRRKFKMTTDSNHSLPVAPNLLDSQFAPAQPNTHYVGDITYIPTQEGWLYLATVIDLYSRQVVGWSMNEHMKAELVNDALLMAIWKRKPERGLIWHTDRGSQYASDSHRSLLKTHGIIQSMSRKGNCWDNAVAESFFHSLKVELIHHENFKTREEAKKSIFEYIEVFYNRVRMHSANNYLSPVEYERLLNIA